MVTTPNPILYKTICTKTERHTGEYLSEKILEIIDEIGSTKVLAVITDSASAMLKARRLINEKYPHISVYSCAAHNLHNLVEDIMKLPSFNEVSNSAKEIVKEINSSHLLKSTFTEIQDDMIKSDKTKKAKKVSLKLPGNTRWGSIIFCIESLLYNKKCLKRLVITDGVILKHRVQLNILDDNFWMNLLSLHEIIAPILKWITILEGDYSTLSLVPQAYFEIKTSIEERIENSPLFFEDEEMIEQFIKNRMTSLLTPIHFAAHMLDPKFISNFNPTTPSKQKTLTINEKVMGTNMIFERVSFLYGEDSNQAVEVSVELADYKEQKGIFSQPILSKTMKKLDPVTWWRTNPLDSVLSFVASEILTMPASTAATERTFSKYGNIHNKKRNRLKTERAGKLVYVSHNLKLSENQMSQCQKNKKSQKEERIMFVTPWNEEEFRDYITDAEESENDLWQDDSDANVSDEDNPVDN